MIALMKWNLPKSDSSTYEGFDTTDFFDIFETCDLFDISDFGYTNKLSKNKQGEVFICYHLWRVV